MNRYPCEDCGAKRGVAIYPDGKYCFSCGEYFPDKKLVSHSKPKYSSAVSLTNNIPKDALKWLEKYFIGSEIIEQYQICWDIKTRRIAFPIGEKSFYLRTIDTQVSPKWLFVGDANERCGIITRGNPKIENAVCFVEDIVSAIRLSPIVTSFCVGGTGLLEFSSWKQCVQSPDRRVFLWFDGDIAGRRASEKYARKICYYSTVWTIREYKDPKCFSHIELEHILYSANEKSRYAKQFLEMP